MRLSVIALSALTILTTSTSAELMSHHSTVRALGMGDAFAAVTDDDSALFYNPAGIAKISGINIKFLGLRAGASGAEAIKKIADMQGGEDDAFQETIQDLYGENVWTGVGGTASVYLPMFAFSVFNHADALVRIDNPVFPQLYTSIINDYGYAAGIGIPIGPFIHYGLSLKYIKRTGARVPFGAAAIADLDPDAILDRVTGWGVGYGADMGVNFVIPTPFISPTFSAVWKNMGETHFRSEDPNSDIPRELNDITLGGGLQVSLPLLTISPTVEFRYLNRDDIQLMRKLNFGIEIDLPLVDIRGGFREGYYTAGAGVSLGLFQFDVATYGVELGDYPGQIEDRRYVAEFTMELGIGNFTASGVSKPGSSSSSSGGKSKSIWGGPRLKQRR